MRLIDADALIQQMKLRHGMIGRPSDPDCLVEDAPTVDAVPVVRCKDCKWWDKKAESPYGYCHACKHGHYSEHWEIGIYRVYKGDWFCADGERKEDDDDDYRET